MKLSPQFHRIYKINKMGKMEQRLCNHKQEFMLNFVDSVEKGMLVLALTTEYRGAHL